MTTREQFLKILRKKCRKQHIEFEIIQGSGKGSHYKLKANGKVTFIKSGQISPQYMKLINKQLGLD